MRWTMRSRDEWLVALYVLAALGGIVICWQLSDAPKRRDDAAAREMLSPDPAVRRAAAWREADEKLPVAAGRIAQRLPSEADASVREAFVYALGRVGNPLYFDAVASVAMNDADPYVRHAAWIAAARMDADRFRALAADAPPRADPWDRIGRAYGSLETGDLRGLGDLLELAAAGDEGQRRAASTALYRGVAPILESVGRWPVDVLIREGEIWPAALVSDVRARLTSLSAQRIADDLRRHAQRIGEVRRLAGKLHIARDRLAWLLGANMPRAE